MLAGSRFMLSFDHRYKLVTLPSILQQGKITILVNNSLMQNLALS
jgi:hypothetical protein